MQRNAKSYIIKYAVEHDLENPQIDRSPVNISPVVPTSKLKFFDLEVN